LTIFCDAEEIGKVDDSFLDTMLLFVMKQVLEVSSKFSSANSALVHTMTMAVCWQPLPIQMEIQSLMLV
jgi:hypothetical protein